MLSLGAVAVREGLKDQFYVELAPLEGARCIPEALAISGLSLEFTSTPIRATDVQARAASSS